MSCLNFEACVLSSTKYNDSNGVDLPLFTLLASVFLAARPCKSAELCQLPNDKPLNWILLRLKGLAFGCLSSTYFNDSMFGGVTKAGEDAVVSMLYYHTLDLDDLTLYPMGQ